MIKIGLIKDLRKYKTTYLLLNSLYIISLSAVISFHYFLMPVIISISWASVSTKFTAIGATRRRPVEHDVR